MGSGTHVRHGTESDVQQKRGISMDRSGKAWGLSVVAFATTAVSIGLLLWALNLRQRVDELQVEVAESAQQAKLLEQEVGMLAKQAEKSAGPAGAPAKPKASGALDTADAGEALLNALSQLVPEEDNTNPARQAMQDFLEMFQGEDFKPTEASAASMVDSEYADLFELLGLPEDAEERVRGILRDHTLHTMQNMPDILNIVDMSELNEEDFVERTAEMLEQQEKADADLRKQLSTVLSPTGMAIFEEYEATYDERYARKDFDMDLAMNATGMTGEVRSILLDVLVEEQLAQDAAELEDESVFIPYIQQKMLVLQNSRERLSKILNEQQLAEVDRFIERQRRWLNGIEGREDEIGMPEDFSQRFHGDL